MNLVGWYPVFVLSHTGRHNQFYQFGEFGFTDESISRVQHFVLLNARYSFESLEGQLVTMVGRRKHVLFLFRF